MDRQPAPDDSRPGREPGGDEGFREDPFDVPEPSGPAADAARLEELQRQVDQLNSRLLRSAADYQNFARRSQQNLIEARDQQTFEMAKALVTVLDHFDRALEVDPARASVETVLHGMQMVRDELLKVLNQHGIERIEARPGEAFDPRRHEALMRQPQAGVPENHVAAQLQPGYTFGDRTVRPAKVSVAQ